MPTDSDNVFHFPNPAFDAIAIPTNEIRENRSKIATQCVTCFRLPDKGASFSQCSKCKMAYYCSKECQKANWPVHKIACQPGGKGLNVAKMVNSLIANEFLTFLLGGALATQFNLADKVMKGKVNEHVLCAVAQLGFEPNEKLDLLKMLGLMPTSNISGEYTGMLQILDLRPEPPYPPQAMERTALDLWMKAVAMNKGLPVVLVEFMDSERVQGYTIALPIGADGICLAEAAEPFDMESAMTRVKYQIQFSDKACIEMLNLHIRHDTNNQLRLQMKLRKEDIEMITGIRKRPLSALSKLFQEKVRRENTYTFIGLGHKDVADIVEAREKE